MRFLRFSNDSHQTPIGLLHPTGFIGITNFLKHALQ